MVTRGALERLVPVMMTATTSILGVVPLILAADQPGKEILYPLAVVIFSGLIGSDTPRSGTDACILLDFLWSGRTKANCNK